MSVTCIRCVRSRPSSAGDLVVARDEDGRVAVDLGVDLLVGELVDLVRPRGRLEERLAIELAGGALECELGGQQLLESVDIVSDTALARSLGELDELVGDGNGHPVSILSRALRSSKA